jgi:hypothetical protein
MSHSFSPPTNMDKKRQINICLFISTIFILIEIEIEIGIMMMNYWKTFGNIKKKEKRKNFVETLEDFVEEILWF